MKGDNIMYKVVSFTPPQNSGLDVKANKGLENYLDFGNLDMRVSSGNIAPEATESTKKKRGRPRKDSQSTDIYLADGSDSTNNGLEPYKNGYVETNNMLKNAIMQLDIANADLDKDLTDIRASKTLRKKYDYIAALVSTKSAVISSKITAAREINSSTTKAYELELKRSKELGLQETKDDDKMIMDMYNSMISMPYGNDPNVNQMVLPNTIDATFANSNTQMYSADIDGADADLGYQNYVNNLTPEQNLYRYENDPNVEQVIQYDPETGARRFAYINRQTNQEIPNLPTLPEFLMEEFNLNPAQGIARSANLGQSLPIVATKIDPLKAAKF